MNYFCYSCGNSCGSKIEYPLPLHRYHFLPDALALDDLKTMDGDILETSTNDWSVNVSVSALHNITFLVC